MNPRMMFIATWTIFVHRNTSKNDPHQESEFSILSRRFAPKRDGLLAFGLVVR